MVVPLDQSEPRRTFYYRCDYCGQVESRAVYSQVFELPMLRCDCRGGAVVMNLFGSLEQLERFARMYPDPPGEEK